MKKLTAAEIAEKTTAVGTAIFNGKPVPVAADGVPLVTIGANQGDVAFIAVDSIPKGATIENNTGDVVVAHSETGHHHVVSANMATRFLINDQMVSYLKLDAPYVDVRHLRPNDTHKTFRLLNTKSSVFRINRQHEYTPQGWRRVED